MKIQVECRVAVVSKQNGKDTSQKTIAMKVSGIS
jgi:hypothetical protein